MTSTATPIPSSAPKTASQLQIEGAFLWAFRRAAAVREARRAQKALGDATLERLRSQGLSVVHFNPENITKRMAFRMAQPPKKTTDSNTPPQTAGES